MMDKVRIRGDSNKGFIMTLNAITEHPDFKKNLEKLAEAVLEGIVIPTCERLVQSNDYKWDDQAFEMLKEYLRDAVNDISEEDGD